MPELPEVQTTIDQLIESKIIGKAISDIHSDCPNIIAPYNILDLKKIIIGKSIQKITRKGKYIFFKLHDLWNLVIHLRMSGKFYLADDFTLKKHEHVAFRFSNKIVLKFHDPRKFGKITLTNDINKVLIKIGIDALDPAFTAEWLKNNFPKSKRTLKSILLDQSFISGIGNIYADEIIFDSKLHPLMPANTLTDIQKQKLYISIKEILTTAIKHRGTSLGNGLSNFKSFKDFGTHQNYLSVYGRNKLLCKVCQTPIIKIVVCQRGTYLCSNCQVISSNQIH